MLIQTGSRDEKQEAPFSRFTIPTKKKIPLTLLGLTNLKQHGLVGRRFSIVEDTFAKTFLCSIVFYYLFALKRSSPDCAILTTLCNQPFAEFESKVSEHSHTRVADKREDPVRIVFPYKDQKSANAVRKQLADLSRKINADISPV